ncbi:MAG: amidohydrolase family protein, partial [bacterium]
MHAANTPHVTADAQHPLVTFVGERIWTGDPDRPRASRVTVCGGEIVSIDADMHGKAPGHVIELGSRFLGPAFLDAHLHITLGATTLSQCDLSGSTSRAEFESRIAAHAALLKANSCDESDSEQWLVGFGWNESDWRGSAPDGTWL